MEVIRLCRLCLTFSEYHANIFFDKIKDKELWRLVNSVCELNTFLYDGLPEHICVDCEYTLKKTLSFRNRAIEASSALKLMIQRNKDLWEKFNASKSSKATPKAVRVETPEGTKAVVEPTVAIPPSTGSTIVNKEPAEEEIDIEEWQMPKELKTESMDIEDYGIQSELNTNRNIDNVDPGSASSKVRGNLDASKNSKATRKLEQVVTPEVTKAVVQPAVATPPSTRSTTMNKDSSVGSVADGSPKKSKRLSSPGKSSQRKSNPPSPARTRTVEVEMPSCDDNEQGPSSEKDSTQQSLSEHQSGAEKKVVRPFVCQQCGASYVRKHFLKKHEVAHRNESTSTTCGLPLPSKRDLNSQMQFHSLVRPYSTRSSDLKNFPSLEASEESARKSLEGKSSSICTSQDNSIEISDTNKTINGKDLRADVVPEEESDGLTKSILKDTKSEHSRLKAPLAIRKSRFVCDICRKSLKTKRILINHVRVHSDDRPFSCNLCDKAFKWDNTRYRHELRHMRDEISLGKSEEGNKKKQFSCTECGNHFSTQEGLYYHSNLHTDKHKCNSCGRRFRNKSQLGRHLRSHTKEKPFKCQICSKCFSQKSGLYSHIGTHSSDQQFSCEICDKRFKTYDYKVRHKLIHFRKK